MKTLLSALFVTLLLGTTPALADKYRIVAVVNGDIISNVELAERLDIAISSSGIPNTSEVRQKLLPQILTLLINERLQRQDAKEQGIKIDKGDLDAAVSEIEKQNGLPPGNFKEFIKARGLSEEAIMKQLENQVIWKKIVQRKLTPLLKVGDLELNEAMERPFALPPPPKAPLPKTDRDVNISEMMISGAGKEGQTRQMAEKFVQELRAGSDFKKVARQFSDSFSAQDGGSLGWMKESALSEGIRRAIANLGAGGITAPIPLEDGGFMIIRVNDVREKAQPQSLEKAPTPVIETDSKKLRDALMMKKLSLESRKYIKKLRQKAFIEIRS